MSKSETGPEGWLQIQHPRLNIEFFRNLSFRQSIQRSSPIVDHYYPLRWSVPISACPLTASDAGCTSDVPITWVLDLALYRYYSIDARCNQFAPASSMGNFFNNIFWLSLHYLLIHQQIPLPKRVWQGDHFDRPAHLYIRQSVMHYFLRITMDTQGAGNWSFSFDVIHLHFSELWKASI